MDCPHCGATDQVISTDCAECGRAVMSHTEHELQGEIDFRRADSSPSSTSPDRTRGHDLADTVMKGIIG